LRYGKTNTEEIWPVPTADYEFRGQPKVCPNTVATTIAPVSVKASASAMKILFIGRPDLSADALGSGAPTVDDD
jgi:hypothetical protein